jgi:cyanophycinase
MNQTPKGTLILIGGAEDKGGTAKSKNRNRNYKELEILMELLPKEKKEKKKKIEIITTASNVPVEINKMYADAFKELGYKAVGFINMSNHEEANDPKLVKRIQNSHAVLFSGGDQFRLSTILGTSEVVNAVKDKYLNDSDFILAGTSAGAMALASLMLYEGENNEAMLSQTVMFGSGLGLIDGCIIDTHFIKRGRFGRLAQSVVMNPTCVGIGLGEDTALIIKKGNKAECRGSGMVVIIDGKDVGHTNIAYAERHTPLCIENLRVHILSSHNGYKLREREFVASKKDIRIEKLAQNKIKISEGAHGKEAKKEKKTKQKIKEKSKK